MSSLDWRDIDGSNFVTPVKNQAGCGACWAFASIAALESIQLIQWDDPLMAMDLSEQVLVACAGLGGCSGEFLNVASDWLKANGVPEEECYPYIADDNDTLCANACEDWDDPSALTKLVEWHWIAKAGLFGIRPTVTNLKNALSTYGPLVVQFKVYEDFIAYEGGIYEYVTGDYLGDHAVLLVGYDEVNACFTCKNSWGVDWGEDGYFRIAYDEVGG